MQPYLMDVAAFAALVAVVYGLHIIGYFGLNLAVEAVNRRNSGRRIQTRRGDKRRREEIRKSFGSMLVTSVSVSIGLFAVSKGWTLLAPFDLTWWTALPLFIATMVLFDAWFYFGHRLLHTPALYKFHRQHHYSVSPTVWSTYSDDVVDTAICQGFYAVVPLLLPFPPVILILHRLFDHVNGTLGHAGFEYFASPTARHPSPMLCATYHDLHHSAFKYNFANYFSFWDRLLGTVHPGYDRMVAEVERTAPPLKLFGPAGEDGSRTGDEAGRA